MSDMPRVVAATVTYGDRFERLCRETVDRAFAAGVAEVVVVDNGSAPASAAALQQFAAKHDGVILVRNDRNLGSARAFGSAISAALASEPDFIWLLDDDNWVQPETLRTLLEAQSEEAHTRGDGRVVVCARRVPNALHDRVLQGVAVSAVYPPVGAFLSFDGWTFLRRVLRIGISGTPRLRPRIPYAPYGGLLVTPDIVRAVGLPDPALVLYVDDTAWTAGIVAHDHEIALVAEAVITDAEGKWSQAHTGNSISASIRSGQQDRLYLSTRNRAWFDHSRLRTVAARGRYAINRAIVFAMVFPLAFRSSTREGHRAFSSAVKAGENADFSRETALGAERWSDDAPDEAQR